MKTLLFIILFASLYVNGQETLNDKIALAARQLVCSGPDEQRPVTLNAGIVQKEDSLAIIIKVRIAPGWHIYDHVPSSLPYIRTDRILQLPENVQAIGNWEKSRSTASVNDPGVLIYEKEALFVQKARIVLPGKAGSTIRAGLYYQTCNLRQCLPPVEKTFELTYQ